MKTLFGSILALGLLASNLAASPAFSPEVGSQIEAAPGEFLVKADPEIAREAGLDPVRAVGFGWTLVKAPASDGFDAGARQIESLTGLPVEPNYLYRLADEPLFEDQWPLENVGQSGGTPDADIDILDAWAVTDGESNVVIAVLDTGLEFDHVDISPVLWTNQLEVDGNGIDDDGNGYIDDINGWDAVNSDADPNDTHGHGTFVGSIAAGAANDAGMAGVAPGARLMAVQVCSDSGTCSDANIIAGIDYAVANGADVANMSFGGGGASAALQTAIAAASQAGMTIVVAAGNDGLSNDLFPQYPANFDTPGLISVAASNHNDVLAGFSNFGATTVDLVAPGESVWGADIPTGWDEGSGTSLATPHVSGAAALVKTLRPGAEPEVIKNIILESADAKASLEGSSVTGGRLNAASAVQLATRPVVVARATPPAATRPFTVIFDGTDSQDPNGNIVGYSWELPNGEKVDGPAVEWKATTAGQHKATLTVTDNDGNKAAKSVTVHANDAPIAVGNLSATLAEAPARITVSGIDSSDPDGEIVEWEWSTGGGSVKIDTTELLIEDMGIHELTLTVTDDFGATASSTHHILIGANFADTDGTVFHDAIVWLSAVGITNSCNPPGNDEFCPGEFVTRGQMAAFFVRAMGYRDDGGGDLFVDDDGSIFETAIDRLATAGVTQGCNPPDNDEFCPGGLVTRGQMAAFFVRAMGYRDDGGGDLFVDDDGSIFETAIGRLATAGVTQGCNPPDNDEFCPGGLVTRGQMAAFFKRALPNLGR